MTIRNLKSLIAIAEHGSFAAAAEALLLTQSAVSVQIRNLERELDAELFDRSKRPPVLSEAGRALVPQARKIVESYDRLKSREADGQGYSGSMRLGSVGSLLTGLIPRVLAVLQDRYPQLHVELTSGLTTELVDLVGRGTLDASVVSDLAGPPPGMVCRPILREPLVMVAPPDAPDEPPARLLERYAFIRYSPQSSAGRNIEAAVRAAGLKPRESMRLDWIEAVEAMVSGGLGVSILPHRTYQRHAGPPLKRLGFGSAQRFRTLCLIYREDGSDLQQCEVLLEAFADAARQTQSS